MKDYSSNYSSNYSSGSKVLEIKHSAANKYKQMLREYASSVLLATGFNFFPWYYKGDKGKKINSFEAGFELYKELYSCSKEKIGYGYELETYEVNSRIYSKQTVIKSVVVTTLDDYLMFIGKVREFKEFSQALKVLKNYFLDQSYSLEALYSWAVVNLDFLQEKKEPNYYPSLFLALDWLIEHPNSGLYIREIPIEVHTKFIEENSKIIASLYGNIKNSDISMSFEDIFGLKKKETLIRFRRKDNRNEMALPLSSFAAMNVDENLSNIQNVYVVENEIVYLTFPLDGKSMCIFGSGFQTAILSAASWLGDKNLYYFGDLDEHGFEMLGLFRFHFPSVKSFLMDKQTYSDHLQYAASGKIAPLTYEKYLTLEEKETLDLLRSNPKKNRLEQERISVSYIEKAMERFNIILEQ